MHYAPEDYNNEECLRKRIERCQKNSKLVGSITNNVYMDECNFNSHLTRRFGRAHQGLRCNWRLKNGREGVIAHDVTLGAYNTSKFFKFI